MAKTFLVLQDAEGNFLPMAFITPYDEAGEYRARQYAKKLEEGEIIIEVEIIAKDKEWAETKIIKNEKAL